jgi:hypothetical protein
VARAFGCARRGPHPPGLRRRWPGPPPARPQKMPRAGPRDRRGALYRGAGSGGVWVAAPGAGRRACGWDKNPAAGGGGAFVGPCQGRRRAVQPRGRWGARHPGRPPPRGPGARGRSAAVRARGKGLEGTVARRGAGAPRRRGGRGGAAARARAAGPAAAPPPRPAPPCGGQWAAGGGAAAGKNGAGRLRVPCTLLKVLFRCVVWVCVEGEREAQVWVGGCVARAVGFFSGASGRVQASAGGDAQCAGGLRGLRRGQWGGRGRGNGGARGQRGVFFSRGVSGAPLGGRRWRCGGLGRAHCIECAAASPAAAAAA